MHLTTLWKDIPYTIGYVILLYGSLRFLIQDAHKKNLVSSLVFIVLGFSFIFFMRFNGIIAVFLSLASFIVLKPQLKKLWIWIGLSFLIAFIAMRCMFVLGNIIETPTRYNAMHSVHYLGYLIKNDVPMEEKDMQFLNEIMPIQQWQERYQPTMVGYLAHQGYFKNQKACTQKNQRRLNFLGLKYLATYPFSFVKFKYESSIGYLLKSCPNYCTTPFFLSNDTFPFYPPPLPFSQNLYCRD